MWYGTGIRVIKAYGTDWFVMLDGSWSSVLTRRQAKAQYETHVRYLVKGDDHESPKG